MKYKIIKNRQLIKDNNFAGYKGENRAETLEFDIPLELQEYTKTINFETDDGNFFDILDSNIYIIKNNLTKYDEVRFFIEFTKQINENEIQKIKTSVATLPLKPSFDVGKEITEEEIQILDALIFRLEEATNRANAISEDLEQKVANDYYRGEKGDKGDKGDPGQIKFIVVNELPTENIDESAIYMKSSSNQEEQNSYEEFIYVNGVWESLGIAQVEVNLSEYAKTTDLENKVDKTSFVYDEETETLTITI